MLVECCQKAADAALLPQQLFRIEYNAIESFREHAESFNRIEMIPSWCEQGGWSGGVA